MDGGTSVEVQYLVEDVHPLFLQVPIGVHPINQLPISASNLALPSVNDRVGESGGIHHIGSV